MSKMPPTLGLIQEEPPQTKRRMNPFLVIGAFVLIAGIAVIVIVFGSAIAAWFTSYLAH